MAKTLLTLLHILLHKEEQRTTKILHASFPYETRTKSRLYAILSICQRRIGNTPEGWIAILEAEKLQNWQKGYPVWASPIYLHKSIF